MVKRAGSMEGMSDRSLEADGHVQEDRAFRSFGPAILRTLGEADTALAIAAIGQRVGAHMLGARPLGSMEEDLELLMESGLVELVPDDKAVRLTEAGRGLVEDGRS